MLNQVEMTSALLSRLRPRSRKPRSFCTRRELSVASKSAGHFKPSPIASLPSRRLCVDGWSLVLQEASVLTVAPAEQRVQFVQDVTACLI